MPMEKSTPAGMKYIVNDETNARTRPPATNPSCIKIRKPKFCMVRFHPNLTASIRVANAGRLPLESLFRSCSIVLQCTQNTAAAGIASPQFGHCLLRGASLSTAPAWVKLPSQPATAQPWFSTQHWWWWGVWHFWHTKTESCSVKIF